MPPARTLVTIATYNERENLPALVDEVLRTAPACNILVIDDNSPDGTGTWADDKAASDPRMRVLHRAGKLGLGTATIAGMKHAIEHDYDYIVNLDADFSHHPRYIPALLDGMDQADVMIGSRYVPSGGTPDWPWHRRLLSRAVNAFARLSLGLSPRDCSGAFRCYRVAPLKQLDFSQVRSRGYAFQEEILWRLKQLGARFGETPILFTDRQHGKSKVSMQEALISAGIILRLGVKNWLRV
jgi:dolichol-phosphate mannosyltransferase